MRKITQWLREARQQKRVHSDDLERIINRCVNRYGHFFPDYFATKNGSKTVHHFGVAGIPPISLERVHGNRDCVPYPYVTYILDGLDGIATYIDCRLDEEDDDNDNE